MSNNFLETLDNDQLTRKYHKDIDDLIDEMTNAIKMLNNRMIQLMEENKVDRPPEVELLLISKAIEGISSAMFERSEGFELMEQFQIGDQLTEELTEKRTLH